MREASIFALGAERQRRTRIDSQKASSTRVARMAKGRPGSVGLAGVIGNERPIMGWDKTSVSQIAATIRTGGRMWDRQRLGRHDQHVDGIQRHRDQHFQPLEIDSVTWMGEAVVPDLLKTAWQDMLPGTDRRLVGGG
jgi:hypothetical protein